MVLLKDSNMWHSVNTLPPTNEDVFGHCYSRDLLITNGREMFVGYYEVFKENPGWNGWRIKGRDGYNIDNVKYWRELPELPL